MGRASRRAAQRALAPRDRQELEQKLAEQHHLLQLHAETFDADPSHTVVSLSLATVVRVLVHDTKQSESVLGLLGIKNRLAFADTALPIGALRKMTSSPGLVSLEIAAGGQGIRWIAPLAQLPAGRLNKTALFQPWWETPLHRDGHGNTWSRRDFVLHLANPRRRRTC